MTRLFAMTAELRAANVEAHVVELSSADEERLFESVEPTFGAAGVEAAQRGRDAWREFLVRWFAHTVKLAITFDAEDTLVR